MEFDDELFEITLDMIVQFATGIKEEPPLGFYTRPSLSFKEELCFPEANTCLNQLYIPTKITSFEKFKYNMAYAIANTEGFGQI